MVALSFRRAPDFDRRADIVEATLDCIADCGIRATSVRAVAARAGISNGLIRHHFKSKDNLIVEAYRRTIELMTAPAREALLATDEPAGRRLVRFTVASLTGQVSDPRLLSLWATFIAQVRTNADMAEAHQSGYRGYRSGLEVLIRAVLADNGRNPGDFEIMQLAIAVSAVTDGLWIEGCLSADEIDSETQIAVGLKSVGAILGVQLPVSLE